MKPTPTGIAVALALAVVIIIFVLPNFPLLDSSVPSGAANVQSAGDSNQSPTTTMPNQDVTQLQITDEVVGTGPAAAAGDVVTVNYVGSLTNGTVFDASANHGTSGFTFNLGAGQVIRGWDQGIVGMKVGGKRKLIIPASLAYGEQAIGNIIPANSTLVFEVELLKVEKAAR